jgi:DNA-binding transcriptional LysR family regulator
MQNLEPLLIFVTVAEMGSFTHAADSLGIQKGRASTAVRKLEEDLGVRLLHRTTRSVQLTEDGRVFHARARDLLADVAYLARYGVPRSLGDLKRQEHRTIHFETTLGARSIGWEYPDGESYATLQLPGALHVNGAQTYEAAALAGLGLIQAPLLGIGRYLESGALVEVLPDLGRRPLAVSLVVAHRRNLSRRVRAFMKWIENVLAPYLE